MPFVLDASSTLPWCFRDEASPHTDALFTLANSGERIHVPAHWPAEVLSGLTRAVRRGRLEDESAERFPASLLTYDIVVDRSSPENHWSEALPLTKTYELSAYDATYLALAMRLRIPLATLDDRLQLAARIEGFLFAPTTS